MKRAAAGLTLVEILVAITILAVGVIGAMTMQSTGLQATRTSEVSQRLNAAARAEIAVMRLRLGSEHWTASGTTGCTTSGAGDCSVAVSLCRADGATLDCSSTSSEPDAWAVRVTVREDGHEVKLDDIVLRE